MRSNMTGPEQLLWKAPRGESLGIKFRRQFGIGPYIADFYSPRNKLVIEIDGGSHAHPNARTYDDERDAFMIGLGINVLRFSNHEVLSNIDDVLLRIQEAIPLPLAKGESEGV